METRTKMLILAALAVVAFVFQGQSHPSPLPTPRPDGPDLVAVFKNSPQGHGADDAAKFAGLCRAIEMMLTKERTSPDADRRLTTGARIDDFRLQVRVMYMDRQSFNVKYPGLKAVLVDWFDQQVGKSGGKVDDAALDKWIAAFKKLAESAEYATSQL